MQNRLTVAQVLARFDREVGLDATPRARAAGSADAPTSVLAAPSAPVDRPEPVARQGTPRVAVAAPVQARPAISVAHAYSAAVLAPAGDARARAALLAEIEARHAATCPHCTTATGHSQLVFGEGAAAAEMMFVGEAPGEAEDRTGRPFVGAAGEKLDEMIRAMGLRREEVYVANVLKSRPPENRTPMPDEVAACGPFLVEQILAVRPRVIVTLGGPATKFVCGVETGISRLRGTWQSWTPPAGASCEPIPVMPTYHPAYVLRTYTKQVRAEVWSDLRAALARIDRRPPERVAASEG
jgi:uracil-DNA glycosylase family 4